MRRRPLLSVTTALLLVAAPTVATAHEQHGAEQGHLDPVQRNVEVVGHLDLFAGGEERPGRISDVAAWGNYAYLGAFYKPDCREGGVYVIDISDPAQPEEAGFIPTSPGSFVGEGVQVIDLQLGAGKFNGQVLVMNNENCSLVEGGLPVGRGGLSLWDVTDPLDPKPLAEHVGDFDRKNPSSRLFFGVPNPIHSAYAWQDGDRAYVILVDDADDLDFDIFDITDPRNPTLVTETGMPDWEKGARNPRQTPGPNGNALFHHDLVVKQVDDRFLALTSYWDAGYLIVDVTDPSNPTLLRDTDFATEEPFAAEMGLPAGTAPEGNAHQAEFSFDDRFFIGTDEDFNPYRVQGTIDGGDFAGDVYAAANGSAVPPVGEDNPLSGGTHFVGTACVPLAGAPQPIALIERGGCTFDVKAANAANAGYEAGLLFNNDATSCESLINMGVTGTIHFLSIPRSAALKLLGIAPGDDPCAQSAGTPFRDGSATTVSSFFDGWGYVHLFDANTMEDLGQYAVPESLDPQYARGFGALSVHEVAQHPSEHRAYLSYYAAGFRVIEYDETGIREVGAFIDEGGNDFWGVEVHTLPGASEHVVLASDRDSGLYVLRYNAPDQTPPACNERTTTRGRPSPCTPPGRR